MRNYILINIYYCYSYSINIVSEMLQRDFKKSDNKTVFLRKKLLQKWLDNVYSCTRNASPKIWIADKRSFVTLDLSRSLNNFFFDMHLLKINSNSLQIDFPQIFDVRMMMMS